MRPQKRKRMPAQTKARAAVILDHFAAGRHGRQSYGRFDGFGLQLARAIVGRRKERQRFIMQPFDGPDSFAA